MTAKWIKEISEITGRQGSGADAFLSIEKILWKINALLKRAAQHTDNEQLHDEIIKETKNVETD